MKTIYILAIALCAMAAMPSEASAQYRFNYVQGQGFGSLDSNFIPLPTWSPTYGTYIYTYAPRYEYRSNVSTFYYNKRQRIQADRQNRVIQQLQQNAVPK